MPKKLSLFINLEDLQKRLRRIFRVFVLFFHRNRFFFNFIRFRGWTGLSIFLQIPRYLWKYFQRNLWTEENCFYGEGCEKSQKLLLIGTKKIEFLEWIIRTKKSFEWWKFWGKKFCWRFFQKTIEQNSQKKVFQNFSLFSFWLIS